MTNWTRIVMNHETQRLVAALPYATFDAMEISGHKWKDFGFRTFREMSYPPFDICDVASPSPQYDLIIAEQVFEHLLRPYQAAKNVLALLRPGGYFLITTPFLLPVHDCPVDCTRWTPLGLSHFLDECGFTIDRVRASSWGNEKCVIANLKKWTPYKKWRHSLKHSAKHAVVVWALAQKTPALEGGHDA